MKAIARAITTLILMMLGAGLYAQHTDAQIDDSITTYIIPNNTKSITAQQLQDILQLLNDNKVNQDSALTVTAFSGDTVFVTYWNGVLDTLYKNTPAGWTDGGNYVVLTTTTDTVGIGATSPDYKLEVAVGAEQIARFRRDDNGNAEIIMKSDNSAAALGSTQIDVTTGTDYDIAFGGNDNTTFDSDGDMHILNTATDQLTFGDDDVIVYESVDDNLAFSVGGTVRFNVGSVVTAGTHLRPTSTSTYDLGASSKRWSTFYTTNITDSTTGTRFKSEVVYEDTFWDDLRVEGLSVKLGATSPEFKSSGLGGLNLNFFNDNQDDVVYFTVQLPHSYKPGTDISPHVHYMLDADGEAGEEVVFQFEYTWANYTAAFAVGAQVTDTITTYINVASQVDDTHYLSDFTSNITGTSKTESSVLVCRLTRLASGDARDDYAHDVGFLYFDIHFEANKPGSDAETP